MKVVLVEPEIPQNTGNIARTCAVTNSSLHLVRPLGFSTEDKYLKRAGLDYWHLLDVYYYDSINEVLNKYSNSKAFFATTKAPQGYHEVNYSQDCLLVFGKETAGLSEKLLQNNLESCVRIPMIDDARSLNLSNSVSIILYEALRQTNFSEFEIDGKFKNKC
jgi:tRNA (cytidine/uridine-2'-O-)-methyltransferase